MFKKAKKMLPMALHGLCAIAGIGQLAYLLSILTMLNSIEDAAIFSVGLWILICSLFILYFWYTTYRLARDPLLITKMRHTITFVTYGILILLFILWALQILVFATNGMEWTQFLVLLAGIVGIWVIFVLLTTGLILDRAKAGRETKQLWKLAALCLLLVWFLMVGSFYLKYTSGIALSVSASKWMSPGYSKTVYTKNYTITYGRYWVPVAMTITDKARWEKLVNNLDVENIKAAKYPTSSRFGHADMGRSVLVVTNDGEYVTQIDLGVARFTEPSWTPGVIVSTTRFLHRFRELMMKRDISEGQ